MGCLFSLQDFKKISINVFEKIAANNSETKDLYICAPANSRDEAVKIANYYKDLTVKYKDKNN